MIWLAAIGLIVAVAAYLCAPFFGRSHSRTSEAEVAAYREELLALKDDNASPARQTELQQRLLQAAKAKPAQPVKRSAVLPIIIAIGLLGGTLGVYGLIGQPNFVPISATNQPSFEDLLPQLEARLEEAPDDPTGWYLYGRTLMLVNRFEDGFAAYERALDLSDNNPEIAKELTSAREYARSVQSGPSADDIAAAQNMTANERDMMIQGMVAGLRDKLANEPNDPEGWTRLLRARKVLGQTAEAEADMTALHAALPDQADTIIREAGWAE